MDAQRHPWIRGGVTIAKALLDKIDEEARAAYGNGASAGSEPSRLSLARLEGVRTLEVSSKPPATLTE